MRFPCRRGGAALPGTTESVQGLFPSTHSRVNRAKWISRPPASGCTCHTATKAPSVAWVTPGYETPRRVEVATIRGVLH